MTTRSITLWQEPDGNYRVKSFTNTTELTVGMVVKRERVQFWSTIRGVHFSVLGPTPQDAVDPQIDLFPAKKRRAKAEKPAIAT